MKKLLFLVSAAVAAAGSLFAANRIIDISDSEKVQVFDEPGALTFRFPDNATGEAQLLIVGGGGAGGGIMGGGGGGGQVVYQTDLQLDPKVAYDVTVADGGVASGGGSGGDGGTSSFVAKDASYSVEAIGGGGGWGNWGGGPGRDGANGGGAGGGGADAMSGGAALVEGGFPGGAKIQGNYGCAGGSGAAGLGTDNTKPRPHGGPGITNDITGVEVIYAYGGGGGGYKSSLGGLGGALDGYGDGEKTDKTVAATPGREGTGGGGGGGVYDGAGHGADGGSGTVIIRYMLDLGMPVADAPVIVSNDKGTVRMSVKVVSGVARISAVFTDVESGVATTNDFTAEAVGVGTYEADYTLEADHCYTFAALLTDDRHEPYLASGEYAFYNGDVVVEKKSDAFEFDLVPGAFTVSRSAAESATVIDLTVNYTVGGTAIPDQTYVALSGSVTIPAGESSAEIVVTPLDDVQTGADTTVDLTLSSSPRYAVPEGEGSSAQVVIYNASDFFVDAAEGFYPHVVTFTAAVADPADGIDWDFGDGTEIVHTTDPVIAHTYQLPGHYTVSLTYAGTTVTKENFVAAHPKTIYLDAASENPVAPYYTRETAAKKLSDAYSVAVDDSTILVAPGRYNQGSRLAVERAVSIIGEGDTPSAAVISNTSVNVWAFNTCLYIANARAFVANLTMENGWTRNNGYGGGLAIMSPGGTVSNCVIRGAHADVVTGWVRGAGAYVEGNGLLTHSIIEDCNFTGSADNDYCGNGVCVGGNGRVENCLIRNCHATNGGNIICAWSANAVIRNCTVVDSTCGRSGGVDGFGAYVSSGKIINTVVVGVGRQARGDTPAVDCTPWGPANKAANFVNCATDGDTPINDTCVLATKSDFKNYEVGDLTPAICKALYDAGDDTGISTTDLAGNPRLFNKHVDIGCYESQRVAGLMMIVR